MPIARYALILTAPLGPIADWRDERRADAMDAPAPIVTAETVTDYPCPPSWDATLAEVW